MLSSLRNTCKTKTIQTQLYITLTVLIQWILASSQLQTNFGHRIVSYEEILNDVTTNVFSQETLDDFSRVVIDEYRRQLIVGARNHILRLDLSDLKILEMVDWKPGLVNVTTCLAKGQTEDLCHNYIRVLLLHNNTVLICGTNAFSPVCSIRNPLRLEKIESWLSGVAKCPYNPRHNSTALLSADGNLYTATVTDFTARDAAISRLLGPSKHLRSVHHNSRWLNEPDFVSSYEIDDYVYFFFREAAIEYINCGKAVYSRVARICKSDAGGRKFLLDDNWTTFVKARMNCSNGGDYPFYFNELQDTFYDEYSRLIYAVFNTPATSIYGSAVCVYSLDDINIAFAQAYKYQADASMAWVREPNTHPNFQCSDIERGDGSSRNLVDAQKFQLMDQAVQPINLAPLVSIEKERYTHILVDYVKVQTKAAQKENKILYLVTLEGRIHKMSIISSDPENKLMEPGKEQESTSKKNKTNPKTTVCLVESLELSTYLRPGYILSVKLHKSEGSLIVSTVDSVLKFSTERCSRYSTKRQCKNAQDPYCDWMEESQGKGRCASIGNSNITSCPISDPDAIDGEWSQWSEWHYCHHTYFVLTTTDDSCRCRTRSCSDPAPQFGGRACVGHSVEVANCSVPKHFTAFGRWSDWGPWTECSNDCGSGHMSRIRTCLPILPEFTADVNCIGNSMEWRECTGVHCTEVQKSSDWSRWFRTTLGEGHGYKEERHRCTCSATGIEPAFLIEPQLKTVARYCSASGSDCKSEPNMDVDGGWSDWSDWSPCSVSCSTGYQTRTRRCDNPIPEGNGAKCMGPPIEQRTCSLQPCYVEARWSCWSDFTRCSVSCGRGGWKQRTRDCVGGQAGSKGCEGENLEVIQCDVIPCPDDPELGEVRISQNATEIVQSNKEISWYFISGLAGFVLAIPITFITTYLCQRRRLRKRKWEKTMQERVRVKPNIYSNPREMNINSSPVSNHHYYTLPSTPHPKFPPSPSPVPTRRMHNTMSNHVGSYRSHLDPTPFEPLELTPLAHSPGIGRKSPSTFSRAPLTVKEAEMWRCTLQRPSLRNDIYMNERGPYC